MKKSELEALRPIAMKIGTAALEAALEFLPRVTEAMGSTDSPITWSIAVKATRDPRTGVVECRIRPKAPKIPTEDMHETTITLDVSGGQMTMLFDGTKEEMELAAREAEEPVDDGYVPIDNVRSESDVDSGSTLTTDDDVPLH